MFCRMCGERIPDDSETCPMCGEEQHRATTEETKKGEGTDKIPVKILKGVGKTIVTVGSPILMAAGSMAISVVSNVVSDEVGKGLKKGLKKEITKWRKTRRSKK